MYSSIKWQSSTLQNCSYFCTNLIPPPHLQIGKCFQKDVAELLSLEENDLDYLTFSKAPRDLSCKAIG